MLLREGSSDDGSESGKTTVGRVGEKGVYIGRGSTFGNPYRVGLDGTRTEVIQRYREYFYGRISSDLAFRKAVEDLAGKRLLCYCRPKACHGDVIVEYLDGDGRS